MDFQSKIRKLYGLLFPTGRAWQYTRGSENREGLTEVFTDGIDEAFTDGLGQSFTSFQPELIASEGAKIIDAKLKAFNQAYEDTLNVQNSILPNNDGFDSEDASKWEKSLQIQKNTTDLEIRKQRILRQLNYPNGVVERSYYKFIEDQIRAAGFDVYVVENRFWNGSEFEVSDPDLIGTQEFQYGLGEYGENEYAGDISGVDYTEIIANYIDESLDSNYFDADPQNPVGYGEGQYGEFEYSADRSVLSRDIQLQGSFFIGGQTYPSIVNVPLGRKDEFRQLVIKFKPMHTLCFAYINYN